jgi:CDGSH-type Zn-finger protein
LVERDDVRIWISENGPYLVSGGIPLTRRAPVLSEHGEPLDWAHGADFEAGEKYALCRCGRSSNKPFCDGTHKQIGFDGTLIADPVSRPELHPGDGIVLTDDKSLCAHYGFCGNRRTNVWEMIGETANPGVGPEVVAMVGRCPSGRLAVLQQVGAEPIEPELDPTIATIPDGALWAQGRIPIQAADGTEYEVRNRVTLCRCGESRNKPFCDGSHVRIGFRGP